MAPSQSPVAIRAARIAMVLLAALTPGVYFVRLTGPGLEIVKRVTRLR